MGYNVMARTCPSRVVLHRIGARWTVFVVNALEHGPMRFVELKTHIQGITPKVLTETLRTLERDGLIARTDYEENPTESVRAHRARPLAAGAAARAVRRWAEAHVPEIQAANEAAAADGARWSLIADDASCRPRQVRAAEARGRRTCGRRRTPAPSGRTPAA